MTWWKSNVKVCYTVEELQEAIDWFGEGDLSHIALDTETMGINWLQLTQEMHVSTKERTKVLLDERDKVYGKEALDPRTNHLAVGQLATYDDRCIIAVLKDPKVADLFQFFLRLLQGKNPVWLLHNAKFDYHQFAHHYDLRFDDQRLHDTQLCESLIKGARDYGSVSLSTVSQTYPLPEHLCKVKTGSAVSDWWTRPLDDNQIEYAAIDVLSLRHIMKHQKARMKADNLLRVRQLECRLTPRLVRLEDTGASFDRDKLSEFLVRANEVRNQKQDVYRETFHGIKPTESKKMLERIKEHYGIVPTKTQYDKEAGGFVAKESVDKFALLEAGLAHDPAIEAYIALKELGNKITWAEKALVAPDNLMRVTFHQLAAWDTGEGEDGGARTGRMSTSPQLQNVSNFLKQFIVADDGWVILSSDQGGVELRLMASIADVAALKDAFNKGISPHKVMCSRITGLDVEKVSKKAREYRIAKECNFGFIYGMGGPSFCKQVLRATDGEERLSEEEGWAFRDQFFSVYPEVKYYHQRQHALGCLNGYVETRSGRRRYYNVADRPTVEYPYKNFWNPFEGQWTEYKHNASATFMAADWKWKNVTYNHPIQGTGADLTKEATAAAIDQFVRLNNQANHRVARMFAVVHDSNDSIVREDYLDQALKIHHTCIEAAMQKYIPDVPPEVEHSVGRSWAGPPDDGKGNGSVHSIREMDYGCWVYPRDLDDNGLEAWMKTEFQQEVKYEGVMV